MWSQAILPDPDLMEETLFAMARDQTRLHDFGDTDFLSALRALLPAMREEAHLNPLGRVIGHGSLLKVLKERAWATRLFKEHPEIDARPLAPPVIIVGPMRSGTTRIQRLLAQDRRFAHLKLWEAMCPAPWPRSRRGRSDPRAAYVKRGLGFLNWINPQIAASHPTGAHEPDEELGLLEASFWGAQIEAQRRIPSYARWAETADARPAYAYMARLLKLIGWWRGEDPGKPWLLKTPEHMQNLDVLLDTFPGARIIFTHREPTRVVASSASLAWNQMVVQTDALDPHWVGAEWLHKTAWRIDRVEEVRATSTFPAIDITFDELDQDWRAAVRRIYSFLGMALPGDVGDAMHAYMQREAKTGRHREHRYILEDFGLREAEVADRFRAYSTRYNVR